MPIHTPYRLDIEQLVLPVLLGVPAEERAAPQRVELDIVLHFARPLPDWEQDAAGFICYAKVSEYVLSFIEGKEFKLIEYLTLQIHAALRGFLADNVPDIAAETYVTLRLRKPALPVAFSVGPAVFSYTDLPADAVSA